MYNGIKRIIKPIYNTTFEGIEVNSSILSDTEEINSANIVKGIGSSFRLRTYSYISKYKMILLITVEMKIQYPQRVPDPNRIQLTY